MNFYIFQKNILRNKKSMANNYTHCNNVESYLGNITAITSCSCGNNGSIENCLDYSMSLKSSSMAESIECSNWCALYNFQDYWVYVQRDGNLPFTENGIAEKDSNYPGIPNKGSNEKTNWIGLIFIIFNVFLLFHK